MQMPEFQVPYGEFVAHLPQPKLKVVLQRKEAGTPDFAFGTMIESIDDLDAALNNVLAAILAMHDVPRPLS